MTIVFKISDNLKDKLINYYMDLRKDTTPPYAVFQAVEADTTITLYESGKVMFQGISADIDANIWIDLEKKYNNRIIDINGKEKDKKNKNEKKESDYFYNNYPTMGSDEVGTGDYFGPIVVTAAYVDTTDKEYLNKLKVGDSKRITDDRILEIAPLIMDKIKYNTIILNNSDYNKNYSEEINMNKIKAILHNKALLSLLDKEVNPKYIVVDQFASKNKFYEYISDVPKIVKNITFLTKAEDKVLSVACASIIARYFFLKEMEKMESELSMVIPKGASEKVDEVAESIIKDKGFDYLSNIVKLNFKNTQKIKDRLK